MRVRARIGLCLRVRACVLCARVSVSVRVRVCVNPYIARIPRGVEQVATLTRLLLGFFSYTGFLGRGAHRARRG